jgi:hypothetical protein
MDIRITDHGNIWVDGKQYIGLDRMNQLLQEKGAIDYDRIQAIVAEAVKTPDITEEQVRAFCKARNWTIYDKALLDDRLASQYRLGYNEGAKDADERFETLKVKFNEDLGALKTANSKLKVEFVKRLYEGLGNWAKEHKIGYTADDFVLIETGIDAVKEVIQSQLTLNEMRRVFDSVKFKPDKPAGDGCGFVD